jgi:hypothetical protein
MRRSALPLVLVVGHPLLEVDDDLHRGLPGDLLHGLEDSLQRRMVEVALAEGGRVPQVEELALGAETEVDADRALFPPVALGPGPRIRRHASLLFTPTSFSPPACTMEGSESPCLLSRM